MSSIGVGDTHTVVLVGEASAGAPLAAAWALGRYGIATCTSSKEASTLACRRARSHARDRSSPHRELHGAGERMRVLVVGGLSRLDAHYKEFAKSGLEVDCHLQ